MTNPFIDVAAAAGPRVRATIKREIPTVSGGVDRYIDFLRARGYKDIANVISVLKGSDGRRHGKPSMGREPALAKSRIGNTPLYRTSESDFTLWFVGRCPLDEMAPSTRKRIMIALRGYLDYCYQQGWIDASVLGAKQSLPESAPQTEWMTPEQLPPISELVVSDTRFDDYERFEYDTLASTGLRSAEVVDLVTSDLSARSLVVIVRQGKGRGAGKQREVPVDEGYAQRWQEHVERHDIRPGAPIFFHRHQVPVGGRGGEMRWEANPKRRATPKVLRSMCAKLNDAIIDARRRSVLDAGDCPQFEITPKVLRKTFACNQYILERLGLGGLGIIELQTALGHANLETTRRYLATVDRWLNAKVERVNTVDAARQIMAEVAKHEAIPGE